MDRRELAMRLIDSREHLLEHPVSRRAVRKVEAEGGCGVIGMACSIPIAGRHLLRSLLQMRNRGNGKGGGVAMVGFAPATFGVTPEVLRRDYMLAVAYLDPSARAEVESGYLKPLFDVDHVHRFEIAEVPDLDTAPPEVVITFARVRPDAVEAFAEERGLTGLPLEALEDELVYQNTFSLNKAFYASLGEKRAFVLSHGKDMLALKLVGYGDDVIHAYQLEDVKAHVWIGHHRYPTKGRVWHPGGAHPFVGLHEALVHNGDFANYASVGAYLAQHNIYPLFLTDTEVSVLVFDLLHRTFGYPLEYVIEALAPTTERDFAQLPQEKQSVYQMLQAVHIHGSPDGPWFFLIAQSAQTANGPREARLIGITDTSMLRPQVFAIQQGAEGEPAIGFAASEKQAIDAVLKGLAEEDPRFWSRPDRVWNARGGSHTDGGAFVFRVVRREDGCAQLVCDDKFGRPVQVDSATRPFYPASLADVIRVPELDLGGDPESVFQETVRSLQTWSYAEAVGFIEALKGRMNLAGARSGALALLGSLIDRRYPTGTLRRSSLLSLLDVALEAFVESVRAVPSDDFLYHGRGMPLPQPSNGRQAVVVDAHGYPHEGSRSLAIELVRLVRSGFRHLVVTRVHGHRFIANGLGPATEGVRVDVFGSSGDYLASGIDGADVVVHGSGQDQLAQIMKGGRLVVHGDVGQTFMYGAKGGEAYVLGNAAGRPLINAVGKPRVVINGTCLDYLAESFMAGDPLNGGGFVILNGLGFDGAGTLVDLETPYPGGNLFSLASGGAIFVRDPRGVLGEDQLNSGKFAAFEGHHWELILPTLQVNERMFGIPVARLLQLEGVSLPPERVYRRIVPTRHEALQPEEAWVRH